MDERGIPVARATFKTQKDGLSNGALNLKLHGFLDSRNHLKYFR